MMHFLDTDSVSILQQAEALEAQARERDGRSSDPTVGSKAQALYDAETDRLFALAWEGYHRALPLIRRAVSEHGGEADWSMLAQVLMDIDIHPNSMTADRNGLYWETQYCWLHLYFTTGSEEYFEKARLCEAFRCATVRKLEEDTDLAGRTNP